jgi:predicted RNA methylase
MKLTHAQAKAHEQASDLLTKQLLTDEERCFVLEHWRAGARHINSLAGAYFTPCGLARDLACEVGEGSIIDLCAGIGTLAFHARRWAEPDQRIVCVEMNPDYVAVGRKILPYATWMCCDIFDMPNVGHFSCAISNPPFGRTSRSGRSPRYQ